MKSGLTSGPRWSKRSAALVACVMLGAVAPGSVVRGQGRANTPAASQPAPIKDALGRDTPRGTVLGFMAAARDRRDNVAPLYLNTRLRDQAAVDLAHKLYVVLDLRLPARLNELSDRPEGSLANPLKPDQDLIATIPTSAGPLEVVVEHVPNGAAGLVWLFSRKTLDEIPNAYDEVDLVSLDRFVPSVLRPRIAGIPVFQWLVLCLVLPLFYRASGLLPARLVPGPARLLVFVVSIRLLLRVVALPLVERRFWSASSTLLAIAAAVWALLLSNGACERYVRRRIESSGRDEIVGMLRLVRRFADVLVLAAATLVTLLYFGIDPTAALAGLGIGGIAVALAAQKTLENVIGGLSIIFDQAVRVGDTLKLGETIGTVDSIGLRSTRIRTLDRTIVSVPNGQIANANIETLSLRDKFWFHHVIGLRYETTSTQVRLVVDGIRHHLTTDPAIDRSRPIRVRFFRFGSFSLDIEVFAYIFASDWEAFLERQQELLLDLIDIVERAGATIALPSQILHFAEAPVAARHTAEPA
jgi:MscS family membrane protein